MKPARAPVAALVAALSATTVLALDADSLRVRRAPGGVEVSWTDPTPTIACVLRDATPPPATLLQQVAGLNLIDPAPAVPLLFYDVDEPLSGSCTTLPTRCAAVGALSCGVTVSSATDAPGSTDVVDAYGGCAGPGASGPEIAYTFTATQDGTHDVTLSNAGPGLGVRVLRENAGECDPAQCVGYGDSLLSFAATLGSTYVVVVDGDAAGFFDLRVDCPASGSCAPLRSLACGDTVSGRTDDPGTTSMLSAHAECFANGLDGREAVYAFTASAADTIQARLMSGSGAADVLVLQDDGGGCMTSPCIAYGDAGATFTATAGAPYFIVVDAPAGPAASYTIALSCAGAQCQPDQSLLCGQAIAHNNAWPVDTDVIDSYPCSAFAYPGPEYTFRFTATGAGQATAALSNMTADLDVFVVAEGAGCSGASCLAWGDASADFTLVAGTTYDVIVDGRDGAEGFFRLDLSCTTPPSACDPQGAIRCGDLVGNDSATGRDAIDGWPCAALDESGPEYVYVFAPIGDATVRVVMDLAVQDLDLFVVQHGAGGCDPAGCIAWGDNEVTFGAVAGQVYSVVVDGRNGASDIFRLWMDCQRVPGACRPAAPIACGQTVSSRNDAPGSTDAIDVYDCLIYPEDGPEITHAFTAATDGTARVTLSNMSADLDVFVLRDDGLGCNQASCIGGANMTLDVPVVAGATYFIVAEGFAGAIGSFDLTLECF